MKFCRAKRLYCIFTLWYQETQCLAKYVFGKVYLQHWNTICRNRRVLTRDSWHRSLVFPVPTSWKTCIALFRNLPATWTENLIEIQFDATPRAREKNRAEDIKRSRARQIRESENRASGFTTRFFFRRYRRIKNRR